MSILLKNARYNYISQIYTIVAGVAFIPYYIKMLGSEAYGLVGFFGTMQAWFALLDLGLTAVVLRETTKYLSDKKKYENEYASLCFILNAIFYGVALIIFSTICISSNYLVNGWFHYEHLSSGDVFFSVISIAFFISFKWVSGFYKGIVSGAEDFRFIAFINTLVTTIRYILVIPVFYFFHADVKVFFFLQVIASIIELLLMHYKYTKIRPLCNINIKRGLNGLKCLFGFSSYAGMIYIFYVIVTQADKLILSSVLNLKTYGAFSFAIVFASLINLLAAPVQHVLQPRLVSLFLQKSRNDYFNYYRSVSIIFSILIVCATCLVLFASKTVLLLLAYDQLPLDEMYHIIFLYSIGNALFAISSISYFMQYSQGVIKYHFYGVSTFSFFFICSVLFFSKTGGYIATGYSWLVLNVIYVMFYLPYINSLLLEEYDIKLYFSDLIKVVVPPAIFCLLFEMLYSVAFDSTSVSSISLVLLFVTAFVVVMFLCYRHEIKNRLAIVLKVD